MKSGPSEDSEVQIDAATDAKQLPDLFGGFSGMDFVVEVSETKRGMIHRVK